MGICVMMRRSFRRKGDILKVPELSPMPQSLDRRQVLALLTSFSVTAAISACSHANAFVIGGGPNVSMLIILAQLKKLFEQRQLNVEYRPLQTSKIAFDAVAARQIDVGIVTDANMALIGYSGFGNVRIIGSIMTKTDDAIIARRDAAIRSPLDLRGKRVAYTPATSGEVFLGLFLAHYGIDPREITLTTMTAPAMPIALQHGDVDAVSVWQPFRYNIASLLGENGIQFQNEGIYPAKILLIATEETISGRQNELEKLFTAIEEASRYVKANKAQAITLLSPEVGIDASTLAAAWHEYEFKVGDTDSLTDDLGKISRAFRVTDPGFKTDSVPDYGANISLGIQQKIVEASGRL